MATASSTNGNGAAKLVSVTEFAKLVCSGDGGHIHYPARAKCPDCGAKMGRSKSTVGFMCKVGRIPGAVKPGGEWLIDLSKAVERQAKIKWRRRGRPAEATPGLEEGRSR